MEGVVFAHSRSDPLGKLVNQIDKAVVQHKKTDLRAWVTFLGEDQASLDKKVIDWAASMQSAACLLACSNTFSAHRVIA